MRRGTAGVRRHVRMTMALVCALLLTFAAAAQAAPAAPQQAGFVWWEGESLAKTNLPNPDAPFPGDITEAERDKLSGGSWLYTQGPESDTPYFVEYRVEVPEAATYNFWVRKFWRHGPFRWRFDEGEWAVCGRDIALHDETYLRKFIGANWVYLGQVSLTQGEHTLRVEMLGRTGGGCLDCFVVIDGPFVPRGKLKPGEKSGLARTGYFAWEPGADPLSDDCPIDLRHLNEAEAGQDGFVRREGNGFVLGGGEPVRFWMVQGDGLMRMKDPMVDYWARRLAKYGVNVVRLGMLDLFRDWKEGDTDAFRRKLDRLHHLVSALKREGIYVYLGHLWWHTTSLPVEGAFGLLYFDPDGRRMYLDWVDALVNTPNPYTGLPMAQDPAVAFIEIQNESSLFFWTFRPQSMTAPHREAMERQFAEWAARKHGSVQAALEAWGAEKPPSAVSEVSGDFPADGRLGLYPAGHLTLNDWAVAQRNPKRAADQLQFMTEFQRRFYEDMIRAWRQDLGVKNLITCSNWKTADPRNLGVLERYLYTAGDAICRNTYYDVEYDPRPERFYAVDAGDTYADYSALKPPMFPAPLTVAHVGDHPEMYTENNWCRPNRYRVEWPFLVATYGSMIGMDGWTFFALDTPLWTSQMSVWEVNCPSVLGQFPAAALMFRKGYVQEAPAAVTERMSLQDLYDFGQSALFELTGRDALWVSRIGDLEGAASKAEMRADRLAFFVGKVNRVLTDGPGGLEISPELDACIDHEAQRVRSLTGQLQWDYGTGLVTVDTPQAQGVCGFLKEAGSVELGDVTIDCGNEYGAILVVSLDGKPIAESERLLIQAGTEDWPYGFRTEPVDGKKRIADLGGYPPNVQEVRALVTLKSAGRRAVQVLDANGYPSGRAARVIREGDGLVIILPEDSLYTLVE